MIWGRKLSDTSNRNASQLQFWLVFASALIVRLVLLVHMFHIKPPQQMWTLNEEGAIARSLVVEHRFAAPFHGATGPTAWVAPGYPFLVFFVFRIFGIFTAKSAEAVVLLNGLFSAITSVLILRLGQRTFGKTPGLIAAWTWALSPYAALMAWLIWETCLSAFLLTYAMYRTVILTEDKGRRNGVHAGLSWGVAALVNPALLAPFPFIVLYYVCRDRSKWKPTLAMAVTFAGVVLPWTIRNERVFHKFFLIRSNAAAEVYFGNVGFSLHPRGTSGEYQRIGEAAYTDVMKERLSTYIRTHREKFVVDALQRIVPFWTAPEYLSPATILIALLTLIGFVRGFRCEPHLAMPFLIVVTVYPLTYYISHTFARFRYPIEPVMLLVAAFGVLTLCGRFRRSKSVPIHIS